MTELEKILEIIGDSKCKHGTHKEYILVSQAIKNEYKNDGLQAFINWTYKFGTENKKREAIDLYTKYTKYTPLNRKERLTIGSLKLWAKENNLKLYKELFPRVEPSLIDFLKDKEPVNYEKIIDNKLEEAMTELILTNSDYGSAVVVNLL